MLTAPGACVLYQRPNNSVVELTTLNVHNFELENPDVAELIGLELARLIVDTCYSELLREREETGELLDGKPGNRRIDGKSHPRA